MPIELLFTLLHKREVFFRFENDEEGFHLSIIDRAKYPRIWVDNSQDNEETIIAETLDNIINKATIGDKDWLVRLSGKTIEEVYSAFNEWDIKNRLPRLR
jgi:hypothetical protein